MCMELCRLTDPLNLFQQILFKFLHSTLVPMRMTIHYVMEILPQIQESFFTHHSKDAMSLSNDTRCPSTIMNKRYLTKITPCADSVPILRLVVNHSMSRFLIKNNMTSSRNHNVEVRAFFSLFDDYFFRLN